MITRDSVEVFVTRIKSNEAIKFCKSQSRNQNDFQTPKQDCTLQFDLWTAEKNQVIKRIRGATKHIFSWSKILIPVENASVGDIQVTMHVNKSLEREQSNQVQSWPSPIAGLDCGLDHWTGLTFEPNCITWPPPNQMCLIGSCICCLVAI